MSKFPFFIFLPNFGFNYYLIQILNTLNVNLFILIVTNLFLERVSKTSIFRKIVKIWLNIFSGIIKKRICKQFIRLNFTEPILGISKSNGRNNLRIWEAY